MNQITTVFFVYIDSLTLIYMNYLIVQITAVVSKPSNGSHLIAELKPGDFVRRFYYMLLTIF